MSGSRKARIPDWRQFAKPLWRTEVDLKDGRRLTASVFTVRGEPGALRGAVWLALLGGRLEISDIAALRARRQYFWIWRGPEGPPPPRAPDWAELATPRWAVEVRLADGQRIAFEVCIATERDAQTAGFAIAKLAGYPLPEVAGDD